MSGIHTHTGIVAPLDAANVDTDAIIPKQSYRKITRHWVWSAPRFTTGAFWTMRASSLIPSLYSTKRATKAQVFCSRARTLAVAHHASMRRGHWMITALR